MTRKGTTLLVAAFFGGALALAQVQVQPAPPGQPAPPASPAAQPAQAGPPRLEGEQKLRWVCKQLRIDDKQMQQAEALIAIYNAEFDEQKADPAALLMKIQDKYSEVQAAQNAGNAERAKELQAELKNMAPGVLPEMHFFDSLEEILTPEQKAKLPAMRKRAESPSDGALRPIHVLRAARKLTLAETQREQLEKVLDEFRAASQANRTENAEAAAGRMDKFIQDVRAILTPAQAEAYNKEIESLRESPPAPIPAQVPTVPGATPPAPGQPTPPPVRPGTPAPATPPPAPVPPKPATPGKG